MNLLFTPSDQAFHDFRRHGAELTFMGLLASAPTFLMVNWLTAEAYGGPPPGEPSTLKHLFLLSGLLAATLPWLVGGQAVLLQRALTAITGQARPMREDLRAAAHRVPALARALAIRWGLTLLSLLSCGAALPLVRLWTADMPVRAFLSGSHPRALAEPPQATVVTSQLLAWLLLLTCTLNLALAQAWIASSRILDLQAALPRLQSPVVWVAALLIAATLVEPWRQLALLRCVLATPAGRP